MSERLTERGLREALAEYREVLPRLMARAAEADRRHAEAEKDRNDSYRLVGLVEAAIEDLEARLAAIREESHG